MFDDPFTLAMKCVISERFCTAKYLRNLISDHQNDILIALEDIKGKVNTADSSRCQFYKDVNPEFSVHNIYSSKTIIVEKERISWTRMRLGAQSLAIETGRWNRRGRGRLPVEQRLCSCGDVQNERLVIESCPETNHLRMQYSFTTLENLLIQNQNHSQVCHIVHEILESYE